MSIPISLIILCTFILIALLLVSVANQRQSRARHVRLKLRQLKKKAERLENTVLGLETLIESSEVAKLVNDEIIEMTQAMLKLDPSATYLEVSLLSAKKRSGELANNDHPHNLNRLRESDSQIAGAQQILTEAGGVLRHLLAQHKLTQAELEIFINQLTWAHLQISTISFISQGHKAVSRNDIASAGAYYKRAQQGLMQSNHNDPRRNRMIKELTEIFAGQRLALSLDLMPESEHNPTESTLLADNKPQPDASGE